MLIWENYYEYTVVNFDISTPTRKVRNGCDKFQLSLRYGN